MSVAPPDLSQSVFSVHVTRDIGAPVERVWDTLTDLPKYNEWNPFVREMVVTNEAKEVEEDQTLVVDKFLLMTCYIPPFTTKVFERIATVDYENGRLSWINIDYPSWALRAERWQVLSNSTTGTNETTTHYETWEAFDGVLAHFVKLIGGKLNQAFDAFADGLKARCEE